MVLKGSDETSSLAASLSSAVDLIEGRIDATISNGVHWGARLALTTALSHFPELKPDLELLGPGHNANVMEGQLDALCTWTRRASESLLSRVPSSVA
jgi:hypothetical protein